MGVGFLHVGLLSHHGGTDADGQLCCSYDYGCAGDLGDDKQQRPPVAVPEPLIRHPSDLVVQSLVDGTPEAALPAITGTPGTARTITTAVTASVASTTSLVSSPSHYSSSYSISNDNSYNLRQAHAAGSPASTTRAQQRNDYHAVRSQQQQQQQQQASLQQFVGGSTTLSTASERFAASSATTARTPSDRSTSSRRSQLANTVDRHDGTATASSFSFSSSSSSSSSLSSPTLAMVLSSSTVKESSHPATSVITQIRQLVGHRRKDGRKSIVLDSAT
ncbi:hypothetical protein X777_00940 [Ooceraea biroi]|uniref:Uncharacterized protein n=1 Tax=Ooceraea biroi TaxID=2015173 RepID=A0A026WPE1_OOCBI|nr:hypothetical protein X777_00940 [Ooceraea biroi]